LLVLTLLLPGLPVHAQSEPAATPLPDTAFEPSACPFTLPAPEKEGTTYECGYVTVPMSYQDGSGTIELAVAVLHATGRVVKDDPILWLEGGPGASALIVADTNRNILVEARKERDVILYDQRGSGYSGYLECGSYQSAAAQQAGASGTPYPAAPENDATIEDVYDYALGTAALGYPECWKGYAEQGIDLSTFTTETIARDSIEVLNALGYDQATLWGTSYGGRVAMAIMRAFPERVRAAVLDSPLPLGIRRLARFAELETEPAAQLFAWCAQDRACNRAYPDLEERALALIEQLNAKPLRVSNDDALHAGLRRGLDGAALVRLLTAVLPNNPLVAGSIPRAIADLEQGKTTVAIALLSGSYPPPVKREIPPSLTETTFETLNDPRDARLALSLAMRTVVLCNDEAKAVTLDDIAQANEDAPASPLRTQTPYRSAVTLFAQCEALGIESEPLDTAPPTAEIPTLILAGEFDGTTAPSWSAEAAEALPDATLVNVPSAGHATARWSECARDIASAFVQNPDKTLDTGCLAGETPVLLGPNDPLS
jgi:pimeloyl-ACP methyl ester carboxylesterase